jgi:uncharacterized protein HemY
MIALIHGLFFVLIATAVLSLVGIYQRQEGLILLPVLWKNRRGIQAPSVKQRRRVSATTQRELAELLHGDWETAYRLVGQTRSRNPLKSEAWCWERTIADLLRDRRR